MSAPLAPAATFGYRCPTTRVGVTLAPDCVPLGVEIPPELLHLPLPHIESALVAALSSAATALQEHGAEPDVDGMLDGGPEDSPEGRPDEWGEDDATDAWGEDPPGPDASADACLARLHSVANVLSAAHDDLLTARHTGEAGDGAVWAEANAAGAVTGMRLSPLFSAHGPTRAGEDIAAAAAEAVGAANAARAGIVARALGEALGASLRAGPGSRFVAPQTPGESDR